MKLKIKNEYVLKFVASNIILLTITFNLILLIILIYMQKITINDILIRFITIIQFWTLIFIFIFIPRRYLRKNKYLRYYVKKWIKKYPEIFFIRLRLANYIHDIQFILNAVIRYYIERIIRLLFIGTKYQGMWPCRYSYEKGEIILHVVMEIWSAFIYLILYIYVTIQNIILFYDTKPIKEIIRLRVLGYLMIVGFFYIIGKNWFIVYISFLIILTIIFTYMRMYKMYREQKKEWIELNPNSDYNKVKWNIVSRIIQWYGFNLALGYFSMFQVKKMKYKTMFLFWHLRSPILENLQKKYPNKLFYIRLRNVHFFDKKNQQFLTPKEVELENFYIQYLMLSNINAEKKLIYKYEWVHIISKKKIFLNEMALIGIADWIDEYYHTLQKIGYYIFAILHHSFLKDQIKLSKLNFLKKIGREQEMGFKILLLNITLLTEEYNEKKFNYYLNEIMIIFWAKFIELRPYSKLANNYKKLIEKEGGRRLFIEKYLKDFKHKNKNLQMEQEEIIENINNWINLLFKLEKELKW